jgi:hypothetical protein
MGMDKVSVEGLAMKKTPTLPHPDDLTRIVPDLRKQRLTTGTSIADIKHIHAMPALEVPPCLTVRQWLDIQETQPDP